MLYAVCMGKRTVDREAVLRMLDAGYTPSEIARKAGCSRGTVYTLMGARTPKTATIKATESHTRIESNDPAAVGVAIKRALEAAGWNVTT